jgi:tetratricopeptide (TPR) repeat protein
VDFRSGLDDKEALHRLYCGIAGQAPGDRGSSKPANVQPFDGLRATPDTQWSLKHRYGLSSHFTGRVAEREFLTQWLGGNGEQPLLVLRALGGFGKSALTWYWLLHDVDRGKWTRVVWWSFYDDYTFETFLKETLEYLKVDVPQSARLQADALLRELERQNVLLILDGFERALRAFSGLGAAYQLDGSGAAGEGRDLDCVSTIADDFLRGFASSGGLMKGRVLMTTRLTPRALFVGATHASPLQGMIERELTEMEPTDAVEFFVRQGIRGRRTEIERACAAYGFHPLSLRLLAGLIVKDKRQPLDIAAAGRYERAVSEDVKQRQHHVLEQSYAGLAPESKALLGRIACFRSSVTYDTLAAIVKQETESKPEQGFLSGLFKKKPLSINLEKTLDDLATRGLVHQTNHPISNHLISTFDLHPIVRRYAYDRLTAPERTGVHVILIVYFDAVPTPEKVEKLEDLTPVIELYHHTVRAGKLDEARVLFRDRLVQAMYFQFGAYQLIIELLRALFLDGEVKPPRLKDKQAQSWTVDILGSSYSLSGQPRNAIPLYILGTKFDEELGDKKNLAIGLGNVADDQLKIGALNEAERNLRRQIELGGEINDDFCEAWGHQELGRVLAYRGVWQESEQELATSLKLFEKIQALDWLGITWSYKALKQILIAHERERPFEFNVINQFIQNAISAHDEWSKQNYPIGRNYIRAYWLLGAAYRANNELDKAEENLTKALNLCRQINMVDHEADILLDLARLRYAQGDFNDAQEKASEALVITERSGYVLQGADVNLFLAQYALEQEKDKAKAKAYAEEAKKLATCDGPPYYYKVAYEEAEKFLEQLAG